MPKNYCIMQIWAESGKSALPICNYSQILYQFFTFTQNLKRSRKEKTQRNRPLTAVSLYCSLQPFICPRGIWAPFGHHLRKKHHENRG